MSTKTFLEENKVVIKQENQDQANIFDPYIGQNSAFQAETPPISSQVRFNPSVQTLHEI